MLVYNHEMKAISTYVFSPLGLWVLVLLLISFRLYAYPYFPLLNSDHALTILHIHYWEWPEHFYLYGQDRMGNLIPLLAQPLYYIGLPAIWSEAVVHYAIHVLGCIGFFSLFSKTSTRFLFAIWWFLPNAHLMNLVDFSFGTMLALIGIGLGLLQLFNSTKNNLYLFGYFVMLLLAIWVNDFAIFFAFSIGVVMSFAIWKSWKSALYMPIGKWLISHLVFAGIAGIVFSYYKSQAHVGVESGGVASIENIRAIIQILINTLQEILLFASSNKYESFFAISVLFLLVYTSIKLLKAKEMDVYVYTFLLAMICSLIAIIGSEFTLLNVVPRRYFVIPFMYGFFCFLRILDAQASRGLIINLIAFFGLISGAYSGPYDMESVFPKSLKAKANFIEELNVHAPVGLVGNYWNSYIHSIHQPGLIYSTAKEDDQIRDWDMVERFKSVDRIYVNRDMWMETFPDTLTQYGQLYVKEGEELRICDSNIHLYIKLR